MSPEQRLLDVFAGKATDRAPVVPKIWFDLAARLTGREPRELVEDPGLAVLTTIEAAEQTGCDAARVLLMNRRQTQQEGERLFEFEDGRILGGIDLSGGWATHLDDPADFSIDNPAHTGFRTFRKHPEPRVHSLADVRRIAVPDEAFWEEYCGAMLEAAKTHAAERIALIGDCDSATLAWYIEFRGMEQAMFDLLEEPDLVHATMEKGVAYAVARGKFFLDHGLQVLRLNDSVANMSVISPETWREFILPHMRDVCTELHRYRSDAKIYCHICGNVLPVIEDLVATGLDGIGPLDPMGGFTVAQAREKAGDEITLVGGVNTTDFIHATPEQIAAQARRCIAEGQVNGSRYILSSGCALPRDAERDNLLALRRAAETPRVTPSCQAGH
jgi:uroporphyrinogen-III decarboxylase